MTTVGTHELIIGAPSLHVVGHVSQYFTNEDVGNPVSSEGLYVVPGQYSWDDAWELRRDLLVEIRTTRDDVLATTYLSVQEYGAGPSLPVAIQDLLTSLSDYYQSLESRKETLGRSFGSESF